MKIVGVGNGDPSTLESWAQQEGYEFEIWKDDNETLMDYYSAEAFAGYPARVTKLLDAEGKLILEYVDINAFSTDAAAAPPAEVLADCEKIFGN